MFGLTLLTKKSLIISNRNLKVYGLNSVTCQSHSTRDSLQPHEPHGGSLISRQAVIIIYQKNQYKTKQFFLYIYIWRNYNKMKSKYNSGNKMKFY